MKISVLKLLNRCMYALGFMPIDVFRVFKRKRRSYRSGAWPAYGCNIKRIVMFQMR